MHRYLKYLALAAFALNAPLAHANDAEVRFDDLDLATEKGQQVLDVRIMKAARLACGLGAADTGTRMKDRKAVACVKEAKAKVEAQVAKAIEAKTREG